MITHLHSDKAKRENVKTCDTYAQCIVNTNDSHILLTPIYSTLLNRITPLCHSIISNYLPMYI